MIVGLLSITVKEGTVESMNGYSSRLMPRSPIDLREKNLEVGVRISTSWERY
jgi:hypothetical protein